MTDSALNTEDTPDGEAWLGDMTVVARLANAQDAQALQGCLRAAGIPATLGDAQTVQTNMLWANALGGVRVMVPQALAQRAVEVIAEYDAGAFAIEGDADPALPPAPVATDLRLWHPDLAALLGLWFTPVVGAALQWQNSRVLGDSKLARSADVGLVLAVVATATAAWLIRDQDWSVGIAVQGQRRRQPVHGGVVPRVRAFHRAGSSGARSGASTRSGRSGGSPRSRSAPCWRWASSARRCLEPLARHRSSEGAYSASFPVSEALRAGFAPRPCPVTTSSRNVSPSPASTA